MVSAKVYLLLHACKSACVWEILKLCACKQRGEAPDISLEQTAQQQPDVSGTRSTKCCAWWGRRNWHLSSFFILLLQSHRPLLVGKHPTRSCALCTQPFVAIHFWSRYNFPGTGLNTHSPPKKKGKIINLLELNYLIITLLQKVNNFYENLCQTIFSSSKIIQIYLFRIRARNFITMDDFDAILKIQC